MLMSPRKEGIRFLLLGAVLWLALESNAQQFHALHGSSYSGVASMYNNPASPIGSSLHWNFTPLSFQVISSTNTLKLDSFQLFNTSKTVLDFPNTHQKRFFNQQLDINLFSGFMQMDERSAIGGGLRLRSYSHAISSPFQSSNDSTLTFNRFLQLNYQTPNFSLTGVSSSWLEGTINYSYIATDNEYHRLSLGGSLHLSANVSGAYTRNTRLSVLGQYDATRDDTSFVLTGGTVEYNYSQNYDEWNPNFNATRNLTEFLGMSPISLGMSVGLEYFIFKPSAQYFADETKTYNWKIGISLMDLGKSKFKTGQYTGRFFNNSKTPINDSLVEQSIPDPFNAPALRDSLANLFDTLVALPTQFNVSRPTRLVVNVDKNLGNDFYLNAQLNINFFSTAQSTKLRSRELNFFTLTPRWETQHFGFYLPVQINVQKQFWVGAAAKLGPLVIGTHNLGFLLKKDPYLNGGFYALMSFSPFQTKDKIPKRSRINCY